MLDLPCPKWISSRTDPSVCLDAETQILTKPGLQKMTISELWQGQVRNGLLIAKARAQQGALRRNSDAFLFSDTFGHKKKASGEVYEVLVGLNHRICSVSPVLPQIMASCHQFYGQYKAPLKPVTGFFRLHGLSHAWGRIPSPTASIWLCSIS